MSTQLITIDFWNTLVNGKTFGHLRHQARMEALKELLGDESITSEQLNAAQKKASAEFDEIWLGSHRTLQTRELVSLVVQHLGFTISDDLMDELAVRYAESLLAGPPPPAEGAIEAVKALAETHTLGIISDTMFSPGRVLKTYLGELGILECFRSFAFSDEIGHSKPHPSTFNHILFETGISPDKAAHIGDMEPTDLKGAKNAGFKAILYTGLNDSSADSAFSDAEFGHWSEIVSHFNV